VQAFGASSVLPDKLKEDATVIFNKFIGPKSKTPVNISGSEVATLTTKIESGEISHDMFREAAAQVYWLISSDTFRRFQIQYC
jgi:hypothetical protein